MDDITTETIIEAAPSEAHVADSATPSCAHHWLIEPAAAQDSHGHCTVCGAERVFSNQPVSSYDRDQAAPVSRMDRDLRSGMRSSHRERITLSDEA
ncbi:MAG: hypothetical protein WCL53_08125 [Chloroflexota bacterium]